MALFYKIADLASEYEQIYQLNYKTFVEEIPQHPQNKDNILIDRFNDENIYFICLNETNEQSELVGMLCLRDKRPFSLDLKLENIDKMLPSHQKPCEIRLLSIKDEYRNTKILYELVQKLYIFALEKEYDLVLISGTTRQLRLYKHLGFTPFSESIGTAEASFIPMYQFVDDFKLISK